MADIFKHEVAMGTLDKVGKRLEARQEDLAKRVLHLRGAAEAGKRASMSIQGYLEATKKRLVEKKMDLEDVKERIVLIKQCALLAERQAQADTDQATQFQIQSIGVADALTIVAQAYKREESEMARQVERDAEAEKPVLVLVQEPPVVEEPVVEELPVEEPPVEEPIAVSDSDVVAYAREYNHATLVEQAKSQGLGTGGRKKEIARRILEAS